MNEGGLWKRSMSLSVWVLYGGNLEGRLPYWGPRKICKIRLWKWACFHRGPILKNIGGRSFRRAFKRRVNFFFIRRTFIEDCVRHV
jgi:hypothetical protein